MQREELLSRVMRVAPALYAKGFVPAYACVFFDGKTATTYDELIGLRSNVKVPIKGGVQGALLIGFLKSASGKEVEFSGEGDDFTIKCGRSKLKTSLLPADQRPKQLTVPADLLKQDVDADFVDQVRKLRGFMGTESAEAWRSGVTVDVGEKRTTLWCSDALTISKIELKRKSDKAHAFVMSPRFVDQFCGAAGVTSLGYSPGSTVLLSTYDDGTFLWGNTSEDVRPSGYSDVFGAFDWKSDGWIGMPGGLASSIDRSLLLSSSGDQYEVPLQVDIKGEKMVLNTQSHLGKVRDSLSSKGHADISVRVAPALVKRAIDAGLTEMKFTKDALLMKGEVGGRSLYQALSLFQ